MEISPRRLVRKDGNYFFRTPVVSCPIVQKIVALLYVLVGGGTPTKGVVAEGIASNKVVRFQKQKML